MQWPKIHLNMRMLHAHCTLLVWTKVFIKKVNFNLNKSTTAWLPFAPFPARLVGAGMTLTRGLQPGSPAALGCPVLPLLCIWNKYFFTFPDKTAPLLSTVNVLKTHRDILVCVSCRKNIIAWQAPIGKWKGFYWRKQQYQQPAVHRTVIVLLTLLLTFVPSFAQARAPARLTHPGGPAAGPASASLWDPAVTANLHSFPFPPPSEWKLLKIALLNCITVSQASNWRTKEPNSRSMVWVTR